MKIRVTWDRADGTSAAVESEVNPNDPYKEDREMQVTKAVAAAKTHFKNKFGQLPLANQLRVDVVE